MCISFKLETLTVGTLPLSFGDDNDDVAQKRTQNMSIMTRFNGLRNYAKSLEL